jgi:hypothetical protein
VGINVNTDNTSTVVVIPHAKDQMTSRRKTLIGFCHCAISRANHANRSTVFRNSSMRILALMNSDHQSRSTQPNDNPTQRRPRHQMHRLTNRLPSSTPTSNMASAPTDKKSLTL